MSPATGLDILRGALDGSSPLPPAAALLGWTPLTLEPGHVRVQYSAREEFYNPQGNVQGGFLAAMLDDAMGPALFTTLAADQFAPTLELKVSFLRRAKAGTLVAEGRVVHRTRSVAFLEGTLSDGDGNLVATASATARIQAPRDS
jgi:uncharacterized protein (TIGR00369 family)